MPRALREFNAAAASAAAPMRITPAPCGQAWSVGSTWLDWMPSGDGALRLREVMHEVIAGLGDRR